MSYFRINIDQNSRTYNIEEGKKPLFVKSSHFKQCRKLKKALEDEEYTAVNPDKIKDYLTQLQDKYSSQPSNSLISRIRKTLGIKSTGDKIVSICADLLNNIKEAPPALPIWIQPSRPHKSVSPNSGPSQSDKKNSRSSEDMVAERTHDLEVYEQYSYLEKLPNELLLKMFKNLSGNDLASLVRVSKRMREIVVGFPELAEKVEAAAVSFQNNKILLEYNFINEKKSGGMAPSTVTIPLIFDNKTGRVLASEAYGKTWVFYPDCPSNLKNMINKNSLHSIHNNDYSVVNFDFRVKNWNDSPELHFVNVDLLYFSAKDDLPPFINDTVMQMVDGLEAAYERAWQDFTTILGLKKYYQLNEIPPGYNSHYLCDHLLEHFSPYVAGEIAELRANRIARVKEAFPDSTET